MPFTFNKASCVAVGTFNIYIFQPEWVGRLIGVPDGTEFTIEQDMNRPGLKLSSPNFGTKWIIRPDRLVLETNEPDENLGEIMALVFEKLPYTPLKAIGNNFDFTASNDELQEIRQDLTFPPSNIASPYEIEQKTWHIAVKCDRAVFNLQLCTRANQLLATANVHANLSPADQGFRCNFVGDFFLQRQESIRLMEELLGIRFSDDLHKLRLPDRIHGR